MFKILYEGPGHYNPPKRTKIPDTYTEHYTSEIPGKKVYIYATFTTT